MILALALACADSPTGSTLLEPEETGTPAEDTGDTGTPGDDTGSPDETGDSGGGDTETGCETIVPDATLSPILPGVFTVTWTTEEPGTSVVEWGYEEGGYAWQTIDSGYSTTEHSVVVAGPAPGATVHWRAVTRTATDECVSRDKVSAIAVDPEAPSSIKLNAALNGMSSGFRVMPLSGSQVTVAIVDDQGTPVWWYPVDSQLNTTQAMISRDGTHVVMLVEDRDRRDDIGGILRVSLDRVTTEFFPLSNIHHSFVELPDGGFVYLAADPRTYEGAEVAGDKLVRVDAKGQNPQVLFSTWDHWTPNMDVIFRQSNGYYPAWEDWTHGNGIGLREDGSLLVSFHNVSAIANIDLDGTLRWTLGGEGGLVDSDFRTSDSGRLFEAQHSPVEVDGGILMFDNGAMTGDGYSEAVEYLLDEENGTFTRGWSFDWAESAFVMIMGDVQRMDNGNTLITWGDSGFVTEVTPAGSVVWSIEVAASTVGFMEHVPSLGGVTSL